MSQQNAATPLDFLQAVERDFNVTFGFDIACTSEDNVVTRISLAEQTPILFGIYGYYSDYTIDDKPVDALQQDWRTIEAEVSWLNPPWRNIKPWAKKCSEGTDRIDDSDGVTTVYPGTRIFSLFPAGVGTTWFRQYVLNKCACYFVASPRICFVDPATGKQFVSATGRPQSGFQDTILCDWQGKPGVYSYVWKTVVRKKHEKKVKEIPVVTTSE